MNKKVYTLKVDDKFIEFKWDYANNWEDVLLSDLNGDTIINIAYEEYDHIITVLEKLIHDVNRFNGLDDIEVSHLSKIKIVGIDLDINYKIVEEI